MSTPPNPPGTPSEPEHEGTPVHRPEAEPTPAPAAKPSLRKSPEPGAEPSQPPAPAAAPAPEAAATAAPAPEAESRAAAPAPEAESRAAAPAPEAAAPGEPAGPSLRKDPAAAAAPAPEAEVPAEPARPALRKNPATAEAPAPEAAAPGEPARPSLRKDPAAAAAPAPEAAATAAPESAAPSLDKGPAPAEAPASGTAAAAADAAPEAAAPAAAAAAPSAGPAAQPPAAAEAAVARAGAALAADAPPAAAAPAQAPPPPPPEAYAAPGYPAHGYAAPGMPGGGHLPPGPPGAPVPPQPGNPWAYHGAPGTAGAGPWGAPVQEGNGLAVASLVLGACAIFFGPVPLLFWGGGILGLIAVGTGLGGIKRASAGAGRKAMAVAGTVLGLLGLLCSVGGYFLTERLVDSARHGIEREVDSWPEPDTDGLEIDPDEFGSDDPWPARPGRPTPAPSRGDVPGMTSPLPFGETFAYPDGIKVSLSQPKPYKTKNRYSDVGNAVQMTLTITNDSAKNHNVIYAVPNVRDDKGMTAKLVFDGDVPKLIRGDILPGQSASGVVVFEVPEGTTSLSADISPGTLMQSVKFSGKIG
ncbi:DUF4352 domain-containing protein [Streptomyces globosus]